MEENQEVLRRTNCPAASNLICQPEELGTNEVVVTSFRLSLWNDKVTDMGGYFCFLHFIDEEIQNGSDLPKVTW